MTIKKKKYLIISIIIAFLILAVIIFILWKYSPGWREKNKALIWSKTVNKMWQNTLAIVKKSKFSISGKIVDDEGSPVDDVRVSISQGYPKKFWDESDYVTSVRIVDSNFKIEVSGGSDISLTFSKKGYYNTSNKCYNLPKIKNSLAYSTNILKVGNQKIIMDRQGKLARCKNYSATFFIREEKYFTTFSIPKRKKNFQNKPFAMTKELPAGTIYPDAKRDKNGEIIKVNIRGRMGPCITYLNMIGEESDGFKLFEGQPHRGIIGIKEAPASGYVKQMVFHWPEDMNKDIYFYYKFGNIYGKGKLTSLRCSASGEILMGFKLRQNTETDPAPKVRRNLRTKR